MDFGIMTWFGVVDVWFGRGISSYTYTDESGRRIDLNNI